MPLISESSLIFLIRVSITKMNRVGERGHPCRVPFTILNGLDRVPLTLMLALGAVYKDNIAWINCVGIPKRDRVAVMKDQLTLSNAFSASVPNKTSGVFFCFAISISLITLHELSLPWRP
ncbi:hypothetical protein GDO81_020183 [Engystomops pustulosus]|uniref:Uncharacterized protein n=1 Tax=Engystomops pustulosus TaxID=76066 RepID=A0AAV6YXD6_ENGPU|nr:hypothetical protein GDO81_020183 [Engystomops pustulosus]